ncbi:MAG: response regulator, partial [Acutalibacteraceae bacterium]|nr:response regulator [Acutalibacteraceae bacterium]
MENLKILIADDEERIVRLVSDFLNNAGYDTVTAADGKEALEIFKKQGDELSLAIIDIMMPEIDGWALTKEIRKKSDLPIIMLSARAEEFDLLTGFESGIDEYVTKPFSPAVLVKRVDA